MEEYKWPLPEGFRKPCTLRQLQEALSSHETLASPVLRCDAQRNLHLRPGGCGGIIPRDQVAAPFLSGAQRDIAALSCVGCSVCFQVTGQRIAADGSTEFLLSRRLAQEEAMEHILRHGTPGMVIRGQVTHLAPFGARFRVGETVPGIVRSCKPYGCFVELTPNLSGLADSREDIPEGRLVSVYIRSIQPQTGKIKLQMVQELGQPDFPTPLHYQITGGSVSGWRYRP